MVSWFLLQRGSCKKSGFIKAACNSAMSFWMNMFSHWLAQWFWASFLISLSLNVLIWLWAVDVYSIRRSESSELSKYHLLPFLSPFPAALILCFLHTYLMASLMAQQVKNLPAMQEARETQIRSLGWEDPLEKGNVFHSSILAWRISWTEEPKGLLQSMGVAESQTWVKGLSTHACNTYLQLYVHFSEPHF